MEMEFAEENIMVRFVDLGEGYDGDFNPQDPYDERLLRFDVLTREGKGDWEDVPGGSYCTSLPVDLPEEPTRLALKLILETVKPWIQRGESIKGLCDKLSGIDPTWLKNTRWKDRIRAYGYAVYVSYSQRDEARASFRRQALYSKWRQTMTDTMNQGRIFDAALCLLRDVLDEGLAAPLLGKDEESVNLADLNRVREAI